MKRIAAILIACLLAACGGGEEEETRDTQPVNCQAKPEACK